MSLALQLCRVAAFPRTSTSHFTRCAASLPLCPQGTPLCSVVGATRLSPAHRHRLAARVMAMAGGSSTSEASWEEVLERARPWADARAPKAGDVPLIFYRDANTWCPFCHRVFFYLEERGLRYETQRIHLQGDPREPPKQRWYLERISPLGSVPALAIGDEIVLESLDILRRLDRQFPLGTVTAEVAGSEWARAVVGKSGAFDTDCDEWLHNLDSTREQPLFDQAKAKLKWLEEALSVHAGPFFLPGDRPSWVDAAYVGFLTRVATNYAFFKGFDVYEPQNECPRLAAWLMAIKNSRGGQATWQDADFEQRIYQAHPTRRASAEPCMQLHEIKYGVGEMVNANHENVWRPWPQPQVAGEISVSSSAALEAAWRLHERRHLLAPFLLRKLQEEGVEGAQRHPKAGGIQYKTEVVPPTDEALAAVDAHLRKLAAVLTGLEEAEKDGSFKDSAVAQLGGLIGTPRDMSSAAAAQLRAVLLHVTPS